jgi:hypothetical protein
VETVVTTEQDDYEEYFTYLDELRESGEVNMYGAGPYISAQFGLNKYEARKVVAAWMESFDKRHSESQ